MSNPIHKTMKLINEFEARFGLCLGIEEVCFHKNDHVAYFYPKKRRITLPQKARGQRLKEFVHHEIGHALLVNYKVPRELIELFDFVCPKVEEKYAQKMMDQDEPAPASWVSWYAMTNPVEDFCETLSAWASNDYKITQSWQFGGFSFSPSKDITIRKKVEEVQNLLKFLELR